MSNLSKAPVKKVRKALSDAGMNDTVIELDETARTAEDAAKSTGVELGAIVKSLIFLVGEQPVMALVFGHHVCKMEKLSRALHLEGEVSKASADDVKAATGYSIGGCSPIVHSTEIPIVIDVTLKRFDALYADAGHPHGVFPTTVTELKKLTGGIVFYNIAEPI